ncbi:MAG TPA: hypothetical protein VFJ71_00375 [Candidatus Limnocylindrales bacterium]|nr:hypothetical protein [Candidatus Limnocylindrales bacterium]
MRRTRGVVEIIGMIAIVAVITALLANRNTSLGPDTAVASDALPGPTAVPTASRPAPSVPDAIDGHPVLTVSEAIRQHRNGTLSDPVVIVRGFWSDASVGHSCAAPDAPTGDLEIYCTDREYGITELDEPIEIIDPHGFVTQGIGPWLTPYLENKVPGLQALFSLPRVNGQRFPPVPIVVAGHFDDPRAKDCRPKARQICLDRLVVDRILAFDPALVPPPEPTPQPTPFPFDDPPPGLFDAVACTNGAPVAYAGWTTLRALKIDRGSPDEVGWFVISRDPIPIGDWFADPNDGKTYRVWGQRICFSYPWEQGGMEFDAVPGTEFREYPDGHREPTDAP